MRFEWFDTVQYLIKSYQEYIIFVYISSILAQQKNLQHYIENTVSHKQGRIIKSLCKKLPILSLFKSFSIIIKHASDWSNIRPGHMIIIIIITIHSLYCFIVHSNTHSASPTLFHSFILTALHSLSLYSSSLFRFIQFIDHSLETWWRHCFFLFLGLHVQ